MPTRLHIVHTHCINEQTLQTLIDLTEKCKQVDGNVIGIYEPLLAQNRPQSINLLAYHQGALIGFLSVFFFYEHAAEVIIIIDPNFRLKGIAKQLLEKAQPTLSQYPLKQLIFPSPHKLNSTWFEKKNFHYRNTEYEMQVDLTAHTAEPSGLLHLSLASEADISILSAIDKACFLLHHPDMIKRFQSLLNQNNYALYIAYKDGVPVGKVHMHFAFPKVRLSDIAIIPRLQGQGLGYQLLQQCIHQLQAKQFKIALLNVETDNQRALNLYQRAGFYIINAQDYWEKEIV